MYRLHSTIEKWCEMRSHRIQSTHRIPYRRRNPNIGQPAYLRRREDSKKLIFPLLNKRSPRHGAVGESVLARQSPKIVVL